MVMCGGGPGLADNLGDAALLIEEQFEITRWDQRGCGRSQHTGPYTLDSSIADLTAVITTLSKPPVVLFGHSWGASLALQYAIRRPQDVRGLVYVSGTGAGTLWKQQWRSNIQRRATPERLARIAELEARDRTADEERELVILSWMSDFADETKAAQLATQLSEPWYPVNYECNHALNSEAETWDEQEILTSCRTLTCPVLILHGELDPRPPDATDSLCDALPNVRRVLLPRTGHVPWLEDPDRFTGEILDFADLLARDDKNTLCR